MRRHLLARSLALAVLCVGPARADGVDERAPLDVKFVEALAQRRLYRLVGEFCQMRIAQRSLPPRELAELTAAWIRSDAKQSTEAPPSQRDAHWAELEQTAAQYTKAAAGSPFALLVELQTALALVKRGAIAREVADQPTASESSKLWDASDSPAEPFLRQARDCLRAAIQRLQGVGRRVEELLAETYQRRDEGVDRWTAEELESLRRNTAVELADAYLEQALCYPPASSDRVNALTLALERLAEPCRLDARQFAVVWPARVEHVRCLRLLGQNDQASESLAAWRQDEPSDLWRLRLLAEELRMLLDQGDPARALDLIDRETAAAGDDHWPPQLDEAALEGLLAARGQAAASQRDELTSRAAAWTRRIASRHGPYWHRRAEARLGRAIAGSQTSDDPQLLLAAAKSLYAGGQHLQAVDAYDQAAAQFAAMGNPSAALDAAATAAAILAQNGDLEASFERRRKWAQQMPEHPQAAALHLAAASVAAELARTASPEERESALEQYRDVLRDQVRQWPQAADTDAARWWLARLEMSRRQWTAALELLAAVAPGSASYDEAITATIDCYRRQLEEAARDATPPDRQLNSIVADATRRLQPVVTGQSNQWPQQWSPLQLRVAVELAALQLEFTVVNHRRAGAMLQAATPGLGELDASWRRRAAALRIAALAQGGRFDDAQQAIEAATLAPEDALAIVRSLHLPPATDEVDEGVRRRGELALRALHAAQNSANSLSGQQRSSWQSYEARALAAAGQRTQALAAYQRLIAESPANGDACEAHAALLAAGTDVADLRQALEAYQRIEQRTRPGGARWLRARQARINLLAQLGDSLQSDKLLRLTRVLFPSAEVSAASAGDRH